MQLFRGINVVSVAVLVGTTLLLDLAIPANSMTTHAASSIPTQDTFQDTLVARRPVARRTRRRLNFRVGVRPSNRRVGGFSRAAVCTNQQLLTSLVPPPQNQESINEQQQATVDKTSLEHPTFFFYSPSQSPTTGQLTLHHVLPQAQNGVSLNQIHSVKFQLVGKPGIVGITIPNSAPALQAGQRYLWKVRVDCDPDDSSSNITVGGLVERINVSTPASGDRLAALAEQGIWQDTITYLALQRYQRPQDQAIAEDWANLMEDAGLPQFKQTEIVQMVKN